jgi:hypothetical protein
MLILPKTFSRNDLTKNLTRWMSGSYWYILQNGDFGKDLSKFSIMPKS